MKQTIMTIAALCVMMAAKAQTPEDSARWEILLKQVSVTAQKPLVKQQIDRTIYDVQADEESKSNTTLDMLRKVPYLSVDADGNVKIKGSGNIRIYRDGQLNNSMTSNPKQVLSAIPASMVERIEVITEPGARYDAEGVDGILNIVMKKNHSLNGILGTVTVQTDNQGEPVGSIYLGTKFGKLDLSLNYSIVDLLESHNERNQVQNLHYLDSGNDMMFDTNMKLHGLYHIIGFDASYGIDSLNLISLSLNGQAYGIKFGGDATMNMMNGNDVLWGYRENYDNSRQSFYNFDGKVDYQHLTHRPGEIVTLSYLLSTSDTHDQTGEYYYGWTNRPDYYSFDRYFRDDDGMFVEHTFQLDWERPLSQQHAINAGAKYINRSNQSEGQQFHDNDMFASNDFSHITNVAALYGEYRYTGKKWSASAGLRYEYARLKAKFRDGSADDYSSDLSDLVPFAAVSYRLNDANTFRFNYSSRVERPGISYLNPFRHEDMLQVTEGNPYLKSSRPHRLSLTHTYLSSKLMTSLSVQWATGNDGIGAIISSDGDRIYATYGNIQMYNILSSNLYARWQPSAATNLTLNMGAGPAFIKNPSIGLKQNRWYWEGSLVLSQKIWWKILLNANCGRSDELVSDVYQHLGPLYWFGFNLQRSFLPEDRLTVRVGVSHPFSKYQNFRQYTTQGDYTGYFRQKSVQQWIGGSISYRFGNLRSSVRKANKTIENDDLVGQKKQ